ncbi:uncharacterized protein LOC101241790 isoform X1 [Hydra vulgaris]|uniref:uncharacterized protein LOC101241790 isoform X1 n=3 Tax=Hydra vulgaris TaxID=6087 RepID=UPI0032EA172A
MRIIVSILVWLLYAFSQSVCEFDLIKCRNEFTCLTYPSFCTDDCEAIAAFQYNPAKEKIYIQLWVKAPNQYIAFGQKPSNNDNYMIKIRGQYCYYKNGILLGSFNGNLLDHPSSPEWYSESDGKVKDVNLIESSIDSDGSMMCKIERPLQSGASEYLYDLTDSLLTAIAFGRVNKYGVPLYHFNKYTKSQTPMNFISTTNSIIKQPSTTMLNTTPYQIPNTENANIPFTTSTVVKELVTLQTVGPVATKVMNEFDPKKCGIHYNCFLQPDSCSTNCIAAASFQYINDRKIVQFQLWARSSQMWVGFGQRLPNELGNFMYKLQGQYCRGSSGNIPVFGSFNGNKLAPATPGEPQWISEINGVTLLSAETKPDDSILCKFERSISNIANLYDMSLPLSVAIASGPSLKEKPGYHSSYSKSETAIDFIKTYQILNTENSNTPFTTSAVVKELVTTQAVAPVSTNVMNEFDPKKCGIHYNCFLQPDSCSTNCIAAASFQYINDRKIVQFQLWARSSQMWVGFGQRLPNELGNFMYKLQGQYCQGSSGNIPVFGSFNGNKLAPATPGEPQWISEIIGVTLLSAETKPDGSILCKFERSISNIADLYDMSLPLSVAIASGPSLKEKPGYHSSYSKSETAIDFIKTRYNSSTNMSYSILVSNNGITSSNMSKTHGVLMIIAWLIFVTSGIFISRYMKPQLTEHVFGKECWFRLHQFCMVLSIILICCSMFIIVRHLNGWSQNPDKHNWFGLAAVILCIFQPIFAFFRCNIDDKKRFIFTWVHRIVGILAWSVAVVAIMFGMAKFGIGNEVVVAFFASIFIMFITLDIIKYYYESKHNYFPVIEDHPMDTFTLSLQEVERPYPVKQVTMISNIFLVLIVSFSIVITFYYVKVILGA